MGKKRFELIAVTIVIMVHDIVFGVVHHHFRVGILETEEAGNLT